MIGLARSKGLEPQPSDRSVACGGRVPEGLCALRGGGQRSDARSARCGAAAALLMLHASIRPPRSWMSWLGGRHYIQIQLERSDLATSGPEVPVHFTTGHAGPGPAHRPRQRHPLRLHRQDPRHRGPEHLLPPRGELVVEPDWYRLRLPAHPQWAMHELRQAHARVSGQSPGAWGHGACPSGSPPHPGQATAEATTPASGKSRSE